MWDEVEVEQTGYDYDTNRRPDIFAVINNIPTFIDVGIVQPSAKSYRMVSKPLEIAHRYGRSKVDKYTQLAMDNDAAIMPFILESNGGYGEHAKYVASDIASFASTQSTAFAPSEIVNDMLDAVAVAVQRGNALAIRCSLEKTVLSNWRRRTLSTAQARLLRSQDSRLSLDRLNSQSVASIPPAIIPPAIVADIRPRVPSIVVEDIVDDLWERDVDMNGGDDDVEEGLLRRLSTSSSAVTVCVF